MRVLLLSVLLVTLISTPGCNSKAELDYQDKISALEARELKASKQLEQYGRDFYAQIQSIQAPDPQTGLNTFDATLDAYIQKCQQCFGDLHQIHVEIDGITPPKKYADAHAIYSNAMSIYDSSLPNYISGLQMIRNAQSVQDVNQSEAVFNSVKQFIQQGDENFEKAHGMVFTVEWETITGVILGVFFVVGCAIAFFYWRSRRKRDGTAYPSRPIPAVPGYGPGVTAGGYPSQSYGYPPPAFDAHTPMAGADVPQPADPQWAYPPLNEDPPSAPENGPGFSDNPTWNTLITCPVCSARFVPRGGFCPSCGGKLSGL